jgi:hypothetical protein
MMDPREEIPPHLKAELRRRSEKAHEAEAHRSLLPPAEAFEKWKAGRLGSLDLSRCMRACLSEPLARLNGKYRSSPYEYQVAEAVVDGILDRGEMSAEALECLAPALAVYEGMLASRRRMS